MSEDDGTGAGTLWLSGVIVVVEVDSACDITGDVMLEVVVVMVAIELLMVVAAGRVIPSRTLLAFNKGDIDLNDTSSSISL
jgi:hypothetical protein